MTMKDIDTYLRNLFPKLFSHNDGMSHIIEDDEGEPCSSLFPWFLIVKSGKNMVKSSQEVITGGDVLKTRHPAGRKWTDQFVYFGKLEINTSSRHKFTHSKLYYLQALYAMYQTTRTRLWRMIQKLTPVMEINRWCHPHSPWETMKTVCSDVHGPAWPESRGFGLASDGFGFEELRARPKPSMTAWLWPGLAWAAAQALKTEKWFR
jgi:hypothetical protein